MKQEQREVATRRWRQRRLCTLHAAGKSTPAALRDVNAHGAFLETKARPPLGMMVTLNHPEAGVICGEVSALAGDGIAIAFQPDARALGFALAAIAAGMSRPTACQARQSVTQ